MHPLPLSAALVLVVNDHALKGAGLLPGWLTGKLSDFAGMFFFPVLLAALARRRASVRAADALACVGAAAGFAAVKLWPPANAMWCAVLGPTVLDAGDLIALASTALAWIWLRRGPVSAVRPWIDRAGLVAAALASMATSAVPGPRPPAQALPPHDDSRDCAELTVLGVEPRGPDLALIVHMEDKTPLACVVGFGRVELEATSSGGLAAGAIAPPREERTGSGAARDVTFVFSPPYPLGCPPGAKLVLETTQRSDPPASPFVGHATHTPPGGIALECLPSRTTPVATGAQPALPIVDAGVGL